MARASSRAHVCKLSSVAYLLFLAAFAFCSAAAAQTSDQSTGPSGQMVPDKPPAAPSAAMGQKKDCVEPDPTFTNLQYHGPFKNLVTRIAGKPDIKTVHLHAGEGRICTLPVGKKFTLFVRDTFEPFTFAIAGFNAGVSQASDDDPTFGQGMEGYGRRYGAAFADQVSGDFWGTFFFPTVLHEDPRYYRKAHGSTGGRFMHAVEHTFVTYRDSGRRGPNFSEWMAATSTTALGNLYHPGNSRGFQPAARGVIYSVAYDMGFDILREFWPEVSKNLRLPFVSHTDDEKK